MRIKILGIPKKYFYIIFMCALFRLFYLLFFRVVGIVAGKPVRPVVAVILPATAAPFVSTKIGKAITMFAERRSRPRTKLRCAISRLYRDQ